MSKKIFLSGILWFNIFFHYRIISVKVWTDILVFYMSVFPQSSLQCLLLYEIRGNDTVYHFKEWTFQLWLKCLLWKGAEKQLHTEVRISSSAGGKCIGTTSGVSWWAFLITANCFSSTGTITEKKPRVNLLSVEGNIHHSRALIKYLHTFSFYLQL